MSGIYIHIPFCKQACHYCDFHFSTSLKSKNKLILALIKEIELRKSEFPSQINSLYIGGGTPSLLNEEEITSIFTALKKTYLIFYSNLFRMVFLPFIIVWFILNIMDGYYNDIFYGLLIMNWSFGIIMLFISRAIMIKTFNEEKKVFFIF